MRRRLRLAIGTVLIGGGICLGIALTSSSATPAPNVTPAQLAGASTARAAETELSGATTLMAIGTVLAGGNAMLRTRARRDHAA